MLPIIRHRDKLDRIFDDFFNFELPSYFNNDSKLDVPAVNIKSDDSKFLIDVAVPGIDKDSFHINLEKDILQISSEVKEDSHDDNENFVKKEYHYSSFKREFRLPETVDKEKIKASHKNGVLTIELPKTKESKLVKTIKIS